MNRMDDFEDVICDCGEMCTDVTNLQENGDVWYCKKCKKYICEG